MPKSLFLWLKKCLWRTLFVFFLRYTHHRLRFPVCFLCYTTPPLTPLFSSARFYGVIKLSLWWWTDWKAALYPTLLKLQDRVLTLRIPAINSSVSLSVFLSVCVIKGGGLQHYMCVCVCVCEKTNSLSCSHSITSQAGRVNGVKDTEVWLFNNPPSGFWNSLLNEWRGWSPLFTQHPPLFPSPTIAIRDGQLFTQQLIR